MRKLMSRKKKCYINIATMCMCVVGATFTLIATDKLIGVDKSILFANLFVFIGMYNSIKLYMYVMSHHDEEDSDKRFKPSNMTGHVDNSRGSVSEKENNE